MPAMTKTALSDCSYPESTVYNIRDDIDATITRLKVVIDEEASLRNALRALFVKRREDAIEQVRLANLHLDSVNEEEAAFCDDLMKAVARANEGLEGFGPVGSVKMGNMAMPTFVPIPTAPLENEASLNRAENNCGKTPVAPKPLNRGYGYGITVPPRIPAGPTRSLDMEPLRSPAKSPCGLHNELLRSPARSTRAFDPPRSPARSTHAFADEPTRSPPRSTRGLVEDPERSIRGLFGEPPRSPARSTYAFADEPSRSPARFTHGFYDEPNRSPARSTRGLFDETPRSPARSTHAFEPPRSPARLARGLDLTKSPARPARGIDPMLISPARSNRVPSDAPSRSPARSIRLEDIYLSPDAVIHSQRTPGKTQSSLPPFAFGDNCGSSIEEPTKSPARPSAPLPTTFIFRGGGFGTCATNAGFGFGTSSTANGFSTRPTTNTGFEFGAGSHSPSPIIGFGAASLGNTGFGFGGTSPTVNFGLRPHYPSFGSNISSFGATTHPMQTTAAMEDTPASMDDLFADLT